MFDVCTINNPGNQMTTTVQELIEKEEPKEEK
jgi:hypothetical protein